MPSLVVGLTTFCGAVLLAAAVWIWTYRMRAKELKEDLLIWKDIATVAVRNLEMAANRALITEGKPPFVPLVPVVPEHNSPVTKEGRAVAEMATMRARLTAATKVLGLEARK